MGGCKWLRDGTAEKMRLESDVFDEAVLRGRKGECVRIIGRVNMKSEPLIPVQPPDLMPVTRIYTLCTNPSSMTMNSNSPIQASPIPSPDPQSPFPINLSNPQK